MANPIQYSLVEHNGSRRILIEFELNKAWNEQIKKVPGAKWSKTLKGWTIPDTPENRKKCGLEGKGIIPVKVGVNLPAIAKHKQAAANVVSTSKTALSFISNNNKEELQKFLQQLTLKAYSPSTIRTYKNEFEQLLQATGKYPVQNLQPDDLKRYLLKCIDKGLKENTIHSRLNALKFYYEQVLRRDKFFFEIPRPKKPILLPRVLSELEIAKLFNAIKNKKHKAILFMAYSAGLRVGEVVNLRLRDIDSKRMQILVKQSKGKKDRYVNLSVLLLDILRQYILMCKPRPNEYLFESKQTGSAYPARTVQQIFSDAKIKAGIKKEEGFIV